MPIKINIDGVSMGGNAQLLNGMKISGEKSNVDIKVKDTMLDGNSKTLNNMDSQNAKVHIDINGIKRSGNSEFMNNKTYNGNQQEEKQKNNHYSFEAEMSRNGELKGKNIDLSKVNVEKGQNETNLDRGSR